jgi:hypothetical protein
MWGSIFLHEHDAGDHSGDHELRQILEQDCEFSRSLGPRRQQLLQELQAA